MSAHYEEFGVRCTMADGEDALVTTDAVDAADAQRRVREHKMLFYGPGDAAGRWLANQAPESTITAVHEAKPLGEWSA